MILSARLRCLSVLALICVGGVHAPSQTAEAIAEYSDQGQKALAQGKYAEAEAAFEKLRELEPGVAEVSRIMFVMWVCRDLPSFSNFSAGRALVMVGPGRLPLQRATGAGARPRDRPRRTEEEANPRVALGRDACL